MGIKHKTYPLNPFEDVATRKPKGGKKANPKRELLSEEEANKILEAIKNDTHVPKSSRHEHSHYYPFVYFIFKTGCRNAEAVGIRLKHKP